MSKSLQATLLNLIVSLLSKLPMRYHSCVGSWIGWLLYCLPLKRNTIIAKNIVKCFNHLSPNEHQQLIKQNTKMMGSAIIYTAIAWRWSDNKVLSNIPYKITGIEALNACRKAGKGAFVLAMHSVFLELDGRLVQLKMNEAFYAFSYIKKHDKIHQTMISGRKSFSNTILHNNVRECINLLKQGNVVSYMPDQDYGVKSSIEVSFFNQPATMVTVPARIAQISGAKVFLLDSYWSKSGERVFNLEPIAYDPSDVIGFTKTISSLIESKISQHPDEYLWCHRRFKSTLGRDFYVTNV
ncbi:MAG: hypothetical protein VXY77_00210 [Pseudomonadota bacterium]|nr:hypothetical protein [Pseudomonadota bacterium]